MTTQKSITSGQIKQLERITEDAVEPIIKQLNLDSAGAQRIIERGDEIKRILAPCLMKLATDNTTAKPIAEQVAVLREFLGFNIKTFDENAADRPLPEGADGWFAIPRWEKIASTYNDAVNLVMRAVDEAYAEDLETHLDEVRSFKDYGFVEEEGKLTALRGIMQQQNDHDILVVPAQLVSRYNEFSHSRARNLIAMNEAEFGLGAFEVCCIFLANKDYILSSVREEVLHLNCPGDTFQYRDEKVLGSAYLGFDCQRLDLSGNSPSTLCNSTFATGFLPE